MQPNKLSDPKVTRTRKIVISASLLIFAVVASVAFLIFWLISTLTYHDPVTGAMVESNFALSDSSRLPMWFNLPQSYSRENLTVIIYYYASSDGKPDLKADLIDKKGKSPKDIVMYGGGKVLETKYGHTKKLGSMGLDNPYPSYTEGTIDGIAEIIEHKAMEPIFYISDDKKL
jgi:hypothetical protein